MAGDARRRALCGSGERLAMDRTRVALHLLGMALPARFRDAVLTELGAGEFRGCDVVRAVAILARHTRLRPTPDRPRDLRVKRVLELRVRVAAQADDGLGLATIRHDLRIEAGVAGDADEFRVSGVLQHRLVDDGRDLPDACL